MPFPPNMKGLSPPACVALGNLTELPYWMSPILWKPTVFTRPVSLEAMVSPDWAVVYIPELNVRGEGPVTRWAFYNLTNSLREEVSGFLRAYTSDLTQEQRARKRLLLGAVDIIASGLDPSPLESYWYYGTFHTESDGVWFRSGEYQYEVPPQLASDLPTKPGLARVLAKNGVPNGPVLEIARPAEDG